MENRYLSYRHQQVAYRVCGTGHPLILLHGFGEDGNIWEQQVATLQESNRIYVPDLPGTGLSASALAAESEWTIEKFAHVIKEIALNEHLSTFTLLGHSMGGYITLAFAEAYPDMLQGFGLIHSSAYADNKEKIASRNKGIDFINEHGAVKFLEQMIPGLYGDQFKQLHGEEISRHVESMKEISDESLNSYYKAMMVRPDRTHILSEAQKPVLFIIGAEDKTVNLSDSLAQSHLPEESHVTLLENSAHMGMREETMKTTAAIKAYLWRLNEN